MADSSSHKSFPIWATLLTVLGSMILCALGSWQLVRLDWKHSLLASIEIEYAKDAIQHPLTVNDFMSLKKNTLMRGSVSGHWDSNNIIALYNAKDGHDFYVPLRLKDGGHVLVSIGSGKDTPTLTTKYVTITGAARMQGDPWRFGIKNIPEKGQWVYLDMNDIRAHTSIKDLPQSILYAETQQPKTKSLTITAARYAPNNNHLKYAFFWYFMCIAMVSVYYFRFWSKKHRK
jgi:surfeit locus 1 family protein